MPFLYEANENNVPVGEFPAPLTMTSAPVGRNREVQRFQDVTSVSIRVSDWVGIT